MSPQRFRFRTKSHVHLSMINHAGASTFSSRPHRRLQRFCQTALILHIARQCRKMKNQLQKMDKRYDGQYR
jgi:hypothetical protein